MPDFEPHAACQPRATATVAKPRLPTSRRSYFLRVSVGRSYSGKLIHEETFRVYTTTPVDESESNNAIKMEARPRVARARTQPRQHVPPPIPVARGPGAGFHLSSVTIGLGAGWD